VADVSVFLTHRTGQTIAFCTMLLGHSCPQLYVVHHCLL